MFKCWYCDLNFEVSSKRNEHIISQHNDERVETFMKWVEENAK